jgi:hypothetical protein
MARGVVFIACQEDRAYLSVVKLQSKSSSGKTRRHGRGVF